MVDIWFLYISIRKNKFKFKFSRMLTKQPALKKNPLILLYSMSWIIQTVLNKMKIIGQLVLFIKFYLYMHFNSERFPCTFILFLLFMPSRSREIQTCVGLKKTTPKLAYVASPSFSWRHINFCGGISQSYTSLPCK